MAQKVNKWMQVALGYLTGLVMVVAIIAVMFFLKRHH